jgi:hypothetical protein
MGELFLAAAFVALSVGPVFSEATVGTRWMWYIDKQARTVITSLGRLDKSAISRLTAINCQYLFYQAQAVLGENGVQSVLIAEWRDIDETFAREGLNAFSSMDRAGVWGN